MYAHAVKYNVIYRKILFVLFFGFSSTFLTADCNSCSDMQIIESIDMQMTESLIDMVAMYSNTNKRRVERLSSGSVHGLFDYIITTYDNYEYSALFQINELSICEETGSIANGTLEIRNKVSSDVSDITVTGNIDLKDTNNLNNIYFRYNSGEKTVRINNSYSTYDLEEYLKIMTQKYLQIMNHPIKGS